MHKVNDQEGNNTRRPPVSGVQSDITKSKGLYTCVTVPIYEWCSTFIIEKIHYTLLFS